MYRSYDEHTSPHTQLNFHGVLPPSPTPSAQYAVWQGVSSIGVAVDDDAAGVVRWSCWGWNFWSIWCLMALIGFHHMLVHFSITRRFLNEQCLSCFLRFALMNGLLKHRENNKMRESYLMCSLILFLRSMWITCSDTYKWVMLVSGRVLQKYSHPAFVTS